MEQSKYLGGVINQDIAFIKHPEDVVYNSENFVITTDEGGTYSVRTNIKGNTRLLTIPDTYYKTKIAFNQSNLIGLVQGESYTFTFDLNGTSIPFVTIFTDYPTLLHDLYLSIYNSIEDGTAWNSVLFADYVGSGISAFIDLSSNIPITVSCTSVTSTFNSYLPIPLINDSFDSTIDGSLPTTQCGWDAPSLTDYTYAQDVSPSSAKFSLTTGIYSSSYAVISQNIPIVLTNGLTQVDVTLKVEIDADPGTSLDAAPVSVTVEVDGVQIDATYTFIPVDVNTPYTTGGFKTISFTNPSFVATGVIPYSQPITIIIETVNTANDNSNRVWLDSVKLYGQSQNLADIFTITNNYQTAITGIKIIGWEVIREDIYLVCTNGKFNPDAGESPSGNDVGQIWKLSYSKNGDYTDPANYTFTKIYSNILNMTIYRPIANPGMIIGRYENNEIIKLYWTDNYNVPRFINLADPNIQYLTVEELELFPTLNISEPRLKEIIQTGNVLEGTYQAAYRLRKTRGGETVFSSLSNPIHIVKSNDSTIQYVGTKKSEDPTNYDFFGGNPSYQGSIELAVANKSLLYTIDNIDLNYDFIELCIIYRDKYASVPTSIQIVRTEPITSTSMDLLYTGNEEVVTISLDELSAFTTAITRAKSIVTKKNYMFLSNVDIISRNLEFDARAYRFPQNSTTTYVKDQTGITTQITDTYTLDAEHDAIQDYNNQAPADTTNYLYQYNSTVVGGSGPNVSYKFLTWAECKAAGIYIVLDDSNGQNNITDITGGSSYENLINPTDTWNDGTNSPASYYPPYKNINRNTKSYPESTAKLGQEYYINASFESYVSPYIASLFKTYRRDEMYRFGIQFYDKRGNPYFVNWIADIRMPHIYMPDGSGSKNLDYPLTQYENGVLYAYPLVLKFDVDTSSIDDLISGWHIVRTERKDSDKHIVHQGIIRPTINLNDDSWFTQSNDEFSNGRTTGNYKFIGQVMFYFSPEVAFNKKAYVVEDDFVEIVSMMESEITFQPSLNPSKTSAYTLALFFTYDTLAHVVKNYSYVNNKSSKIPYSIHHAGAMNPLKIKNLLLFQDSANMAYIPSQQYEFPFAGKARWYNYGKGYRDGDGAQTSGPRGLLFEIYGDNAGYFDFGRQAASDRHIEESDGWVGDGNHINFRAYVANCRKNIVGQYGGNTYSARTRNEYIKCSPIITSASSVHVMQGDTFISVVDHMANNSNYGHDQDKSSPSKDHALIRLIPLETEINIDLRTGAQCEGGIYSDYIGLPNKEFYRCKGDKDLTSELPSELIPLYGHISFEEAFNYNYVYSNENNIRKYFPKDITPSNIGKFDVRTYKTAQKENGETGDSWSDVKELAYLEVDSSYGPINNTLVFKDRVLFFQDKAFGVLQIGEQRLQQDPGGENLILGSAGVLERFDYLSTKTGTKHQFSFSVSDYSVVWFDTLARKIIRFRGEGPEAISDIKGISAYLYNRLGGKIQTTDNPYIGEGVHSTYDYRFNRHFMTFLHEEDQTKITVMYNELLDGFEGFTSCYPEVYINDKLNIFTIPYTSNTDQDFIYIQNYGNYATFFDRTYPSKITAIINENPVVEKVLTNLEIVAEGYNDNTYASPQYDPVAEINRADFFDLIRVWDTYQNTDFQGLSTISRRHKTIWNVKVPSDRVKTVQSNIFNPANLEVNRPAITKRMKDKWFAVDLIYNNASNRKFVVQTLKGIYGINSR